MTRSCSIAAMMFVTLCSAACQRAAPTAVDAAPVATTPVPPVTTAPTAPAAPASIAAAAPIAALPSIDCTRASTRFETMVCGNTELRTLDSRLADTYQQALARTDDIPALRAEQRGWIKGRDDCWKAGDAKACVREAYLVRIAELRIRHGLVEVPAPVEYRCGDNAKPFTATIYAADDPRVAVLTYGDDQAIAIATPVASGFRYVADGVDFRAKGAAATVDFFGTKLDCRVMPAR